MTQLLRIRRHRPRKLLASTLVVILPSNHRQSVQPDRIQFQITRAAVSVNFQMYSPGLLCSCKTKL